MSYTHLQEQVFIICFLLLEQRITNVKSPLSAVFVVLMISVMLFKNLFPGVRLASLTHGKVNEV